jgi:hypothetical protein
MKCFRPRSAAPTRLAALAIALAGVISPLAACEQGVEGDRCNPALIETSAASSPSGAAYNEDECHSGFACTVPPTCVIAVCCPTQPPYTDPNCACLANPGAACACTVQALDGGPFVDDSGVAAEAASDAATVAADAASDAAPAPADAASDASDAASVITDASSDALAKGDG